jgi:D-alanyl-lipoteichoic acid acyltransferase DltB (MBOAT superfamily)
MENVNAVTGRAYPVPSFILPIGISFFTLQAVSYLFDVYNGTIPADRNFFRVALFLAFFPQIVEGPICRYSQTADQLWNVGPITGENLTLGLQRIGYGMMKKIVVADRLNAFVGAVFTDYATLPGSVIALGALCYTAQLYMDFSGAMDAVAGTAQVFGVTMPENFQRPFFSKTISEFWTRWHISLGTWFKDHIFYPVTMSKPMKNLTSAARKRIGNHFGPLVAGSIALFCVWFSNGLWHGAAWNYIFFGMYHFVLILTGNLIAPAAKRFHERFHIQPDNRPFRVFQVLRTCVLVVIGELFFRADGLVNGIRMFFRMITVPQFQAVNTELLTTLGMDPADFFITVVTLVIVFCVSLANERGICLRKQLQQKPTPVRWAVLYALIFYILIFGAYGQGYVPVDPMYANF